MILRSLGLLSILSLAAPALAAPTPGRALLALSKTDHTMAIVDPHTLRVLARQPVGPDPHEVIASADGKTGYASVTQSGKGTEISVIDLLNQKALPSIDTGAFIGPHGLSFVGGKLWFTAEGAKSVARYDPTTGRIDWALGTGQDRTHMLIVSDDQKRIVTTNVSSGTVSVIDYLLLPPPPPPPPGMTLPPGAAQAHWDWTETVIPATKGVEGFDISPDGKQLWTAAASDGTIWILDLDAKKAVGTIDAKLLGANRLKFTPDGKRALITNLRDGEVAVYDVASRKELKKIPVGHGAAGMLMDPDGHRAFVSCTPDNWVAVVDLDKLEVAGHIDVGGHPDGLAWAVRKP